MANEHLFLPHRGGASSYLASQPDPNLSLGSFMASERIADHEGVITGFNSDREIIDTSLPGTSLVGAWVVFLDTHLNEVREVIAHDTGTDTLTFREVLQSAPVVSDRFWVFEANGLFDSFDADLCRRRATRYRLGFVLNNTGGQLDDIRIYVRDIQSGPLVCDVAIAVQDVFANAHADVDDLIDEETAPLIGADLGGFSDESQEFRHVRTWDPAVSPFGTGGVSGQKSLRDNGVDDDRPIWIRLSFDIDSPIPLPSTAVFQVYVDSDDGVTVSSFLIVVDVDGVQEVITPLIDRRLRSFGGARLSCVVLDSVSPFEPVPGRTILIEQTAGPGSMNEASDTIQRPGGGPIRRVWDATDDEADVGASVTFGFAVT